MPEDKVYGDKDRDLAIRDRERTADSWIVLQELLAEQAKNINDLTKTIGQLAVALEARPTKREGIKALVGQVLVVLIFVGGFFVQANQSRDDLREFVQQSACRNEQTVQRAFVEAGAKFELSKECQELLDK